MHNWLYVAIPIMEADNEDYYVPFWFSASLNIIFHIHSSPIISAYNYNQ